MDKLKVIFTNTTCFCVFMNVLVSLYTCCCLALVLTMKPNWSTFFTGESVTFGCGMREGRDSDWYGLVKNGQHVLWFNSEKKHTWQFLYAANSGDYQCFAYNTQQHTDKSNKVSLTVSGRCCQEFLNLLFIKINNTSSICAKNKQPICPNISSPVHLIQTQSLM